MPFFLFVGLVFSLTWADEIRLFNTSLYDSRFSNLGFKSPDCFFDGLVFSYNGQ